MGGGPAREGDPLLPSSYALAILGVFGGEGRAPVGRPFGGVVLRPFGGVLRTFGGVVGPFGGVVEGVGELGRAAMRLVTARGGVMGVVRVVRREGDGEGEGN